MILSNCSDKNHCNNEIDLINNNDSIPILNLDISKSSEKIRQELNELFSNKLCGKCSLIDFKIPLNVDGKNIYLKVMTDFDSPICENCPIPMRLRKYYSIIINDSNQLLVEDENIEIKNLESNIDLFLSKIGNDELTPESIKKLIFKIDWTKKTNPDFLNKVLNILLKSYTNYIKEKAMIREKDFCLLENKEISQLQENFPLRIEFDLGKQKKYSEIIKQNFDNRNIKIE